MGSSLSTSTSNNSSKQLEIIQKNADEVNKYQKQLVEVTSGLEKALVQQRTDSIELYQDMEEKLKLAEAEIGRLKKENFLLTLSSTSKLPKETLERIFTIQQQIGEKLNDVDGFDYNKNFQKLLSAVVSFEEIFDLNEFLETYELLLSSADLNGFEVLVKHFRPRVEKLEMNFDRMREEGQERMI